MFHSTESFARLTPEQWQQIIDQQTESGLSQKRFCQSRSISLSSFTNWKRKLSSGLTSTPDGPEHSPDDTWIELPAQPAPTPANKKWNIELTLPGGVILRIRQ